MSLTAHVLKPVFCARVSEGKFLVPMPRVASFSMVLWFANTRLECKLEEASGSIATFVRHPLDRLVSAYHVRRIDDYRYRFWDMPFEQFVEELPGCEDVHVKPQSEVVPKRDFVGRFETLAHSWKEFCEWAGLTHSPLDHVHKSIDRAGEYFTPRTRALAEQFYAADLEAFGY